MRQLNLSLAFILAILAAWSASASPARAGLLVSHAPNYSGVDFPSDFIGGQQILDQFQPTSGGAVMTVEWWGVYRDDVPHTDSFTFRFYNGFTPSPSPDYSAAAVNVTRTATGQTDAFDHQVYDYTATLSVPWSVTVGQVQGFSIVNDVGGFSTGWSWLTSNSTGFGNLYYREQEGASWTLLGGEHMAFALSDDTAITSVPEPSSLVLCIAGIIGLGCTWRRKRTKGTYLFS